MIQIKEIMENPNAIKFIQDQKVDAAAAYERLSITRKLTKEYYQAINGTNTANMPVALKVKYDEALEALMKIIYEEQKLVREGE